MSEENTRYSGVQLLKDEEVFRAVYPHFLGMYQLYVIWFYFIAVSITFMLKRKAILDFLCPRITQHFQVANNTVYLSVWILALAVPAVVIAVSRISLRWIVWIFLAGGAGIYLKEFTSVGIRDSGHFINNIENITVLAFGILGTMGTEWYRRCHVYLVTDRRIVITSNGLWHSERSLTYNKINDLILTQSFIGKLLDFGSIVPLTASGIGAGADMAGGGVGIGASLFGVNMGVGVGGGHSRNVPKESLAYTLFNISQPAEIHNYIMEKMTGGRSA